MSSGYSGRSLVQKLGIRTGERVLLVNAPPGFEARLGRLPKGASHAPEGGVTRFAHLFAKDRAALEKELPGLGRRLGPDGSIWVSWPKRSSKVETDLTDIVVREVGLRSGLVDVKVCSIDSTWSALKFVRRTKDRHASPKRG